MMITKEWIHAHKTPAGAWNRKQIEALGLTWPARKGWQKRLEGTEISFDKQIIFEIHSAERQRIIMESQIPSRQDSGFTGGVLSSHPQADAGIAAANKRISELETTIDSLKRRLGELEGLVLPPI